MCSWHNISFITIWSGFIYIKIRWKTIEKIIGSNNKILQQNNSQPYRIEYDKLIFDNYI